VSRCEGDRLKSVVLPEEHYQLPRDWLEHSTDVVLDELARFGLVASRPHVAEQPGADLLDQPRTVPVALQALSRIVAALAESAHVRVADAGSVGAHGALPLLSLVGPP
jgi:hypothetical protein